MRHFVGYKRDLSEAVVTSGSANGTFWYNPESVNMSDIPPAYTVQMGDRLVAVAVAMAGIGTTNFTARVAPYVMSEGGVTPYTRIGDAIEVSNGGLAVQRYVSAEVDVDLSAYVGRQIIATSGQFQPAGGRLLWDCEPSGMFGNPTVQFPESITTSNIMPTFPAFYLEIESPPPEGYADIVVGDSPVYGDDRSVIKDFTGEPPKAGDQIRYALKSLNGADITVREDLTYSGVYDDVVPLSDEIYLSLWDGEEWVDWTVTVNFEESPSEGITVTTPPEITGTPVVRQELTCNPGTYTSSNGPVSITGYTWHVDGAPVQGVHTNTFIPEDNAYGKVVNCTVQVTDGVNTESYSASTTPLAGIAPQVTLSPVTGKPEVGRTVKVNISVDAVPEAAVVVEWVRVGDDEVLSTGSNTYLITEDELGESIFPRVTASNPEGEVTEDGTPIGPITPFVGITRRNIPPFWQ